MFPGLPVAQKIARRMSTTRVKPSWIVLLLATLFAPAPALSGLSSLPAKAQKAFDEGMTAGAQGNWKLALRYFLDARQAAPNATQIWFNLGVASSKIPSNEFRAIAWFKAYLLASPKGQNAQAVREEVSNLETVYETRLRRVVDALEQLSRSGMDDAISAMNASSLSKDSHISPPMEPLFSPADLGGMFAAMYFYLGDVDAGKRTLESFGVDPFTQCRVQEQFLPEYFALAAKLARVHIYPGCETDGQPVEMDNEVSTSPRPSLDVETLSPEQMYTKAFRDYLAKGGSEGAPDDPASGWTPQKAYTPAYQKEQAKWLKQVMDQGRSDDKTKNRGQYNVADLLKLATVGQVINVRKYREHVFDSDPVYRDHRFDETQLDEFVDSIRGDLQTLDQSNPHAVSSSEDDFGVSSAAQRGDALANWMDSFTALIASYRRMRGPYS